YLDQQSAAHDAIFAAWRAYAAIPAPEFASRASAVTEQIQNNLLPNESVHLLVQQAFAGEPPKSLREVADRYGKLLAAYSGPNVLEDPREESLRLVLWGEAAPVNVAFSDVTNLFKGDARLALMRLRRE